MARVLEAYAKPGLGKFENDDSKPPNPLLSAQYAILRRLCSGLLLAKAKDFNLVYGGKVEKITDDEGMIPPQFWNLLQAHQNACACDWIAGDFSFQIVTGTPFGFGSATAVSFDANNLPALGANPFVAAAMGVEKKAGGAPRSWDWDGALIHLAVVAHSSPDGLFRKNGSDPNQSDIARHLQAWFIEATGNAPEMSQLREYGKRFQQELNALKLRAA